jgi:adenosylhomocysteinase
MQVIDYDIHDPYLAKQGQRRIDWALEEMPVLRELAARFATAQPLQGIRMSGCLHIYQESSK